MFVSSVGSMEYRSVVYNAARDGKVSRLRIYLDKKNWKEVAKLIHAKTNGATPLIMGCRNGHLEVVKYLVEKCNADLEQFGCVTFDGETIEGAPPLWCAAAAGHQLIVKYLINKGCGVNKTTFTNSTPLRAACFDGHTEIVKCLIKNGADIEIANRHGHTCLMISCYKGHQDIAEYMLEIGADVNRKSVKGNTALHDCAESGSLDIMMLLLKHGAKMEQDAYGMSPLLAAAVAGFTKIVEFLIDRPDCTRAEKANGLELLGATYVDKKRDMLGAIRMWRLAVEERYSDKDNLILKPLSTASIPAYENAVEFSTLDELDDLITDPDDMRMQALLVRERILGPAHPDTSYYIRYRGALYADMGNFERCVTLWMYALDMQQSVLEALNPMTQSSFLSFAELFSFMTTEWRTRPPQPVDFKDIMEVLVRAIVELEKGREILEETSPADRDATNFHRLLVIIMHILCLMCRLLPQLSFEQEQLFKQMVYNFVHIDPRGSQGYTPLHLACAKETTNVGRYPVCSFPSNDVVELLLEVGASVDVLDIEGNSALHIAAGSLHTTPNHRPIRMAIFRTLLNAGAHIDCCNEERMTPMQMIRGMTVGEVVPPMSYLSLQCLSARKIMKHEIKYKGIVPQKLEEFIEMH